MATNTAAPIAAATLQGLPYWSTSTPASRSAAMARLRDSQRKASGSARMTMTVARGCMCSESTGDARRNPSLSTRRQLGNARRRGDTRPICSEVDVAPWLPHTGGVSDDYDYLVIGGGSGGLASARRAAAHGARVALVEGARLGGTCVNLGCVPKKIMWNAAVMAHALEDAGDYGFQVAAHGFDWGKLKHRRDAYIARLNEIYRKNLVVDQVEHVPGWARFVGPDRVLVGERRLRAKHVLIATGGRPKVPDLMGAELGITSH